MAMQLVVDFNRPNDYTVHLPTRVDEFWTSKQHSGHSMHEVSYRACYKPQLPEYFIKKLCKTEAIVYDPFMGRGTTLIEAQLGSSSEHFHSYEESWDNTDRSPTARTSRHRLRLIICRITGYGCGFVV